MSYAKIFFSFRLRLFIITAIISLATISCSKTPDVRLSLCQELTVLLLKSPENLQWQEHRSIIKGYQDLEMQVSYSITQANGQKGNDQASCFYPYIQVEPDMEAFNTPTVDYSTYPDKMILKGREVDKQQLAHAINQVMLHQAREGIKKMTQEVEKQLEKIKY